MHKMDLTRDVDSTALHDKLDEPTPWIGLYIATTSLVCTLAMAADASIGFRSKELWFPCKYFTLNAFSLTLLAVTMKLPLDLTSFTIQDDDKLARISSLVFMSTAMANFTTSLWSMTDNEIVLNLAALALLVLTVFGNVAVHIMHLLHFYDVHSIMEEQIVCAVFMLFLLLTLCFSAVMLPTAKRQIHLAYCETRRKISNDKKVEWGNFTLGELKTAVTRYWVMAQTGSSQFVIARSVTCVASGLMCLLMGLTLLQVETRKFSYEGKVSSNYKWSIKLILLVQTIGVAVGGIAPVMRWFVAARFKSSKIGHRSFRDELKVESYWTERLVQWRDRPVPLKIRHHIYRKLLHHAKGLLLNSCIRVQIAIVWASKLVLLISALCVKRLISCIHYIRNLKASCYSKESADEESRTGAEPDYSGYVLLLEGESQLPQKTLRNICSEVDKLIRKGRKMQPSNFIELLNKSVNFNGVREFDTNKHSDQEPPNCWSMPVVTLTSVAVSLANITLDTRKQLLSAVSEGLYFTKLIEKTLDKNGDLAIIRRAADKIWVGVDVHKKWQEVGLLGTNLQHLYDNAGNTVNEFTTRMRSDPLMMQNPLNWPDTVIAAHSMYRITQTILLTHTNNVGQNDEELFERLSVMISGILAACLTNLVSVIIFKCHSDVIEEREESVRQAAILLGQSEGILEILQPRGLPEIDPKEAAYIDSWRAFMAASSSNGTPS
ncbi:hypothetical protein ABFX02_09G020200 [Erythranthe guttata]